MTGRPGPLPMRCSVLLLLLLLLLRRHRAREAAHAFCPCDVVYNCYNYDCFGCARIVIRRKHLYSYQVLLANRFRCTIKYDAICKCRIKAFAPLWVYRRDPLPSRRRRKHGAPRTESPVQLREVGPDRRHLLTESCSGVHLHVCRCRTVDEDCCCISVGSCRRNITACAGVIFAR